MSRSTLSQCSFQAIFCALVLCVGGLFAAEPKIWTGDGTRIWRDGGGNNNWIGGNTFYNGDAVEFSSVWAILPTSKNVILEGNIQSDSIAVMSGAFTFSGGSSNGYLSNSTLNLVVWTHH